MDFLNLPSPIEELQCYPGKERGIRIFMKRDDLIHPEISGNKWRKLKWNIAEAKKGNYKAIITSGGAWSNHLAATAAAGKLFGIKTIGIVRGKHLRETSTLEFCRSQGMKITFASVEQFEAFPQDYDSQVSLEWIDGYIIPLGGENELGVKGCKEIMSEIDIAYDLVCVSVGTGTTMRGIAGSLPGKPIIGFSGVRDHGQHSPEFLYWVHENPHTELTHEFSCGGFAKSNTQLEDFIVNFYQQNKIRLEPVYTGKMMMGVFDMINTGRIQNNTSIVCIHTGGLQGLKGFPDLHKRLFTS